jgi:RNA polymerase sigma factor (sigma-70 family)
MAKEASNQAFEERYERYQRGIYRFVLASVSDPALAEDLCQEIWLKVHEKLGTLRSEEAFPSWLYQVAGRSCISAARGRSSRAAPDALPEVEDSSPGPEQSLLRKEEVRLTWEAIGALSPRQQMALYLREIEGLTYADIASRIGASTASVETLLFRARRMLSDNYRRFFESPGQRCRLARRTMAGLPDGANMVQRLALQMHLEGCRRCSVMAQARTGRKAGRAA